MDKIEKDFLEEAGRTVRKEFVRDIARTIERAPAPAFSQQEKAQVLRQMADQLEKGQQQEKLLSGSRARLDNRPPPIAFFTHAGDHRRYWEGKATAPVPRKEWRAYADQVQAGIDADAKADGCTIPRKDWSKVADSNAREIKKLPPRDRSKDYDRDR